MHTTSASSWQYMYQSDMVMYITHSVKKGFNQGRGLVYRKLDKAPQ